MSKPYPNWARRLLTLMLVLGVPLLLAVPQFASAQSLISGDITGTVTDQSGAAIPGAAVTIKNTGTGLTKTVKTGAAGDYRVGLLQPGSYTVTVTMSGFQTTRQATAVAVGQTATVNLALGVAKGSQTVEVMGNTIPLLQPENSDISTTINQKEVRNLPNPGGDITYYINLTQGVVMNTQGGYGNSSAFGLPATSNNFTINGAEDNDPFLNLNNSGPSNMLLGSNDIAEVNIVANAYSAQYGALGGVQENIITRSGTNSFHGNATYYWANSDMEANDWFNNNQGAPRPFSNANQWGAAVGGPIKKDKAFFFVNYEGLRFVTAPSDPVFLPSANYIMNSAGTATMGLNADGQMEETITNPSVLGKDGACDDDTSSLYLNGNGGECAFYKHMFSLYAGTPQASAAVPNPQETVSAGSVDCLAADAQGNCTLLNSFPTGLTYANKLQANPKNFLKEWLLTARTDYKIGPNDTAFIHFKYDHGLQPTFVDPINPIFNAQSDQPDYEGQLEETHTFSPNLVNQFILSGAWYSANFLSVNQQQATATFPYTLYFGAGSFTDLGGEGYAWPEGRNVTQYQINDDVSWTHGRNTTSFGVLFKRDDVTDSDLGLYTTALGYQYGPGVNGPFDGYDFFSAGNMLQGIQSFPTRMSEPIALYNLGLYIQDQWKLTQNLQVTGGLRLERNANPTCGTNCFARLNGSYNTVDASLSTPYNQSIAAGQSKTFDQFQSFALLPRVGFTYSIPNHPHTLLRGGFGMFTDVFPATIADDLLTNAPLNPQFVDLFDPADPSQPHNFLSSMAATNTAFQTGYKAGGSYDTISAADPNFTPPNMYNVDRNLHYPTYDEYSLQVQQQIGNHTSFQIGYVGNHGYHEPVQNNGVNASQADAGFAFGGLPVNSALPSFGEVTEIQSAASSNYNGLIATVKYQGKNISGMVNYTWSHALDEISNGGILNFGNNSYAPIDPFDLSLNYGNADYDIRHNLNGTYLIDIPHFGGPKVVTAGWRLGGTVFWHTGFPFSVTDGSVTNNVLNASGTYGGTMLANVANTGISHHCGSSAATTACLTKSNFAHPTAFYQAGTQGRNQFFGPGFFNTDMNLMKGFKLPLTDTSEFQIGLQAYNVLNHPNFSNPVFDTSNPSFGQILTTASVPTSVFGSFLGGNASPRILQLKANITF